MTCKAVGRTDVVARTIVPDGASRAPRDNPELQPPANRAARREILAEAARRRVSLHKRWATRVSPLARDRRRRGRPVAASGFDS
eukprot:725043-Prymnesium_polylepis.1